MHPEIEDILNNRNPELFAPNRVMLKNAEAILNYIDDINLERADRFELTPADSLCLLWDTEDLEFHLECLKDGRILYTFRKGGYGKANGCVSLDKFIPLLQDYLLMSIW
ncbi:MAG TPA: hypothetical protein VHA56_21825 [Mucilaginibacter sp.]|nr:hypothetical protein [Mucilaginibacter sp.]